MKILDLTVSREDLEGNRLGEATVRLTECDLREIKELASNAVTRGGASVVTIKAWLTLYDCMIRALLTIGRMKDGARRDKDPKVQRLRVR